jgi:hypothetical protein
MPVLLADHNSSELSKPTITTKTHLYTTQNPKSLHERDSTLSQFTGSKMDLKVEKENKMMMVNSSKDLMHNSSTRINNESKSSNAYHNIDNQQYIYLQNNMLPTMQGIDNHTLMQQNLIKDRVLFNTLTSQIQSGVGSPTILRNGAYGPLEQKVTD